MTRAWDPDRYLPDPARRGEEDHHCPCPDGCRNCEWTCPGKGCANDPKNDPDCPPDEDEDV